MSTTIKLNGLLSLPEDFTEELSPGGLYTIHKSGMRIMPFGMPMELSTHDHEYLGKINVVEIRITKDGSDITFEVLKLFSPEEAEIFTENFIRL